jgi:hypothetical protein
MLFNRNEKRRGHPGLALTVGALAVVGAVSIVNCSKKWVKDKSCKMISMMKGMMKPGEFCD